MTIPIYPYHVNKQSRLYRSFEILIPLLVWAIISMPVWMSFFHPAVAAYLILAYMLYFLYKSLKSAYFATISYRLMKRVEKIDWWKEVKELPGHKEIHHFILIVNYKESFEKLSTTLTYLVNQNYDKKKMHIVLGMELREGVLAKERSRKISQEFGGQFADIFTTYHELLPGEAIGKASNAAYASKFMSNIIRQQGLSPEDVIVTVCDADSLLPSNYLACVTYKFLNNPDHRFHFYTAPVLLYSNFWKLPLPVRMQSIQSSISRFAYISQEDDLIQISTYSTNLWLLEAVGYWDTDIISEDWHIWLQAFFTLGEKVKTVPIYMPIIRDGVLANKMWKTFQTRYEQEKRWAWGVTDIPYAMIRFMHSSHIRFSIKLRRLIHITENHIFWPTSFFLLTVAAFIPPIVNPVFKRTVLGFLLPKLSSFILTFSSVVLILAVYFDYRLRERAKIKTDLKDVPLLFIQWYLLPIISFLFSSLPALEAHTRMLLGKKLEYKVTEKI